MKYEDFCKNSKVILKEADEYKDWAKDAKYQLLTDLAPRVAKLGRSFYSGCGFHYALEERIGRVMLDLAKFHWQPTANWCENIEADQQTAMMNQILFDFLIDDIVKCESRIIDPNTLFPAGTEDES
jgi:hypothetical protein